MIDSLYTKYFQKSRSFLYPALGIKRSSSFLPTGTYIALEGIIEPEDMKLICTFKEDTSEEFKNFEEQMLITNPLYFNTLSIQEYKIYIFNFETYEQDWFHFLLGTYSKFSITLKKAIQSYYGEKSSEFQYIDSYIYPNKYFEVYAKLLDTDVQLLKSVGQLCDPCDLEKETLKIPTEHLENLKKVL